MPHCGGGGGGTTTNRFPKCNPSGNSNTAQDLAFIKDNYQAAVAVSNSTGIPADWVLAWSASETNIQDANGNWQGWGGAKQVAQDGNYFNEEGSGWSLTTQCGPNSFQISTAPHPFACYSSFYNSAMSALTSFGSKYLNAFKSAGDSGEAAAFQAMANVGFNGSSGYGAKVAAVTTGVDALLSCLQANHYM